MSARTLPITAAALDRMKKKVCANRPQLQEIENNYGSRPYFDYVKQKNRLNLHKPFQQRKQEIITIIANETTRLLGSKIGLDVKQQLKKNDSISTAEHTAPIGTAHTLGSLLSTSIPMFANTDPRYKNVITLSCSGVSFNNFLSFSRGFQFHTFHDGQVLDDQITFFGRSTDPKTILSYPPYTHESVIEMKNSLTNPHTKPMQKILEDIYLSPHALSATDFTDQLAITNYYFWQKLFPSFAPEQIPNLIMLSQEKILIKAFLQYHIDSDTPLHRFVFDPDYHTLIEKYFEGITGAFAKDTSIGTFLFWGLRDNVRLQLMREGNKLVSTDGTYSVELKPEPIRTALMRNELFPSVLLTFITLSFYYGLLLGGGASQPTYLTDMKHVYKRLLQEVGDSQTFEDTDHAVTDDFVFFRPHLAFIDAYGQRISATGMDMYLYNDNQWQQIIQATKSITISEFITILLPILYKQFCPDDQKEEELMSISRQDVEAFTGFDKKLPPLFRVE